MAMRLLLQGQAIRAQSMSLMLVIGFSLNACTGESAMQPRAMTQDLESDFELVSSIRTFFGHQSVGGNIVDGIKDLQSQVDQPIIRIVELGSLDVPDSQGALLHTKVGENEKPISKCQDFRRILEEDLDGQVDVAMFKFCYIDFDESSGVDKVFAVYEKTLEELKHRYPNAIFIHVTAPLRYSAGGFGVWARETLGRLNRSKLANVSRNEFNRRLRETFFADPIFDLAASVSTYPDGSREYFTMDGKTYYSMLKGYTDDGGHLNSVGRTYVAADFVRSIADAIRENREKQVAEAGGKKL